VERMGGRWDARGVERRDVARVLEDGGELTGEAIELLGGQVEPGESGDVLRIGAGDRGGHRRPIVGPVAAGPRRLRRAQDVTALSWAPAYTSQARQQYQAATER